MSGITKFAERMESLSPGIHELTIVFTDIRGFSRRVEQEEEDVGLHAAVKIKEEHDELLRRHLDDNSYIKSLGDGCLFLFADACTPIEQVINLQVEFRQFYRGAPPERRLEIRIGMHFGKVYITPGSSMTRWQNDVLSDAVNLASRVTETAPAGTIHITDALYVHCGLEDQLSKHVRLPTGGSVSDLGTIALRGRQKHCHVWQINPFGGRLRPDLSKQQSEPSSGRSLVARLTEDAAIGVAAYLLGRLSSAGSPAPSHSGDAGDSVAAGTDTSQDSKDGQVVPESSPTGANQPGGARDKEA